MLALRWQLCLQRYSESMRVSERVQSGEHSSRRLTPHQSLVLAMSTQLVLGTGKCRDRPGLGLSGLSPPCYELQHNILTLEVLVQCRLGECGPNFLRSCLVTG
jgi:hypothetical protein